jgi:hypothetical protein
MNNLRMAPIESLPIAGVDRMRILAKNEYEGDFAIEDSRFNTDNKEQAKLQLKETISHFTGYYEGCFHPSLQLLRERV